MEQFYSPALQKLVEQALKTDRMIESTRKAQQPYREREYQPPEQSVPRKIKKRDRDDIPITQLPEVIQAIQHASNITPSSSNAPFSPTVLPVTPSSSNAPFSPTILPVTPSSSNAPCSPNVLSVTSATLSAQLNVIPTVVVQMRNTSDSGGQSFPFVLPVKK